MSGLWLVLRPTIPARTAALALAGMMLAVGALAPTPTAAGWVWCWSDPTLVIDGRVVHIDVGVPVDDRQQVTGSTLTVTVPANVTAHLSGVNAENFPITVTLVRGGPWNGKGDIPVTATAVVSAPAGVPTALWAWQAGGGVDTITHGTAGKEMTLSFGVAPTK
jgi:hypothetical protein